MTDPHPNVIANNPPVLRCDNEPCLFHHLGICRFHCHQWQPIKYRATHTPAAPAERKLTVVEDITFEGAAIVQAARKAEREQVLEWAKKHNWPTTGGHRVIGFDKLKEFLEPLRGGGA